METEKRISGPGLWFDDKGKSDGGDAASSAFLHAVMHVIDARLANPSFTVEDLARALHISTRQLYRRMDTHLAMPPGTLLRRMRLERGAKLLERNGVRVSDAAHAVGFKDTRHFSKLFRQTFGVRPAQYRDRRGRAHHRTEDWQISPT